MPHVDFQGRGSLVRYAWLSIAAALITIGLKTVAYLLTGSVGLPASFADIDWDRGSDDEPLPAYLSSHPRHL